MESVRIKNTKAMHKLIICISACPDCKAQYCLSKGGCIHFTCSKCKFQFCAGCNEEMKQIPEKGLYAHHPRDCFYYLRDLKVEQLKELLKVNFKNCLIKLIKI